MEVYLTVFALPGGQCYIELVEESEGQYGIGHTNTLDESVKRFESFYNAVKRDHIWANSAGLSIMQLGPHIIKAPETTNDNAEWLKEFVIKEEAVVLSNISVRPLPTGMPVKSEILNYSVLNVAKDIIDTPNSKISL